MSKKLNITDQIFGRLQAIVIDWYRTNQGKGTYWFCQCEDNNIVSVKLGSLRNGSTQSCGCLFRELASKRCKNSREDLTGQTFTRWFVDSYNPEKSKEMGVPYYDCTCIKDGNKGCVRGSHLKSGGSKSCGCLFRELSSERGRNRKGKNNPNWKEKVSIYCLQCGKERKVIPSLKDIAQFCDINCRIMWMSKRMLGKNNPAWRGGITSLYNEIRNSSEYLDFIQIILKKSNYTCKMSQEVGGILNVHHIKSFAKILEENNITTREEALECKELWNEKNVVVLSEKWHSGIKTDNPNAFHRLYGVRSFTEQDFYKWFEEFSKVS